MRHCLAAADPDARAREVVLPAAWDDAAAAAIAALAPSGGTADLTRLADRWLAPLEMAGGIDVAAQAQHMLLAQGACPSLAAWTGPGGRMGLRVNLGAFADREALAEAAAFAARAASLLASGEASRLELTGLAAWLAGGGLEYDSDGAREAAECLLRELRARVPGVMLCVVPADAVDALLGVETAGLAPDFGPLDATGALSRASHAFLAARAISPEAALAAVLGGCQVLPTASREAYRAMLDRLTPLLDAPPPVPAALPAPPPRAAPRRELPARRGGIAQKAVVGGQKVFVRTGEYADGRPGEVAITLPQASPTTRALIECLSHAIGIGLQHGTPLGEFVEALAGTRFGPAGTVEGDPAVARATSAVDYVMRHLAHAYLPGAKLPPIDSAGEDEPLLPLELPPGAPHRRRGLRVVK